MALYHQPTSEVESGDIFREVVEVDPPVGEDNTERQNDLVHVPF